MPGDGYALLNIVLHKGFSIARSFLPKFLADHGAAAHESTAETSTFKFFCVRCYTENPVIIIASLSLSLALPTSFLVQL